MKIEPTFDFPSNRPSDSTDDSLIIYEDKAVKGLRIEDDGSGRKMFVLQYRLPRRNAALSKVVLASQSQMTIDEARAYARHLLRTAINNGTHPRLELGDTSNAREISFMTKFFARLGSAIVRGFLGSVKRRR